MNRFLASALAAVLLSGCASGGLNTVHAQLERREIDAELLFQATVAALDADVASGKMSVATHDADRFAAWTALQAVRKAHNHGQAIDLSILQSQAQAAKGAK